MSAKVHGVAADPQIQITLYARWLDHAVTWIAATCLVLALGVLLAQVVFRLMPPAEPSGKYSLSARPH